MINLTTAEVSTLCISLEEGPVCSEDVRSQGAVSNIHNMSCADTRCVLYKDLFTREVTSNVGQDIFMALLGYLLFNS